MLIGLTGSIAAGKSTVSGRLAHLGAHVLDADVVAREVVEPGTRGLAMLEQAFGSGILTESGMLDRRALAARVFGNAEMLRTLNAITHPLVHNGFRVIRRALSSGIWRCLSNAVHGNG